MPQGILVALVAGLAGAHGPTKQHSLNVRGVGPVRRRARGCLFLCGVIFALIVRQVVINRDSREVIVEGQSVFTLRVAPRARHVGCTWYVRLTTRIVVGFGRLTRSAHLKRGSAIGLGQRDRSWDDGMPQATAFERHEPCWHASDCVWELAQHLWGMSRAMAVQLPGVGPALAATSVDNFLLVARDATGVEVAFEHAGKYLCRAWQLRLPDASTEAMVPRGPRPPRRQL